MKKLGFLEKFLTLIILLGITTLLFLYTSGFRIERDDENNIDIGKTGMISAKSVPEGASVYIDDKLVTATDDTIASIKPGFHTLKISKLGFVTWEKEIEVFEELVTDITAILVSQSPRLEPLTNTGAKKPSIAPSLSKVAYFSELEEKPGVWIIPLSGGLSLFRSDKYLALQDTKFIRYSKGQNVEWSPDESYLLVTGENSFYYLVDLETNTASTITDPDLIRNDWREKLLKKREAFLENIDINESVRNLALSSNVVWAPDEKKFLYVNQIGDVLEYKVYNLEEPLPVGEKVENLAFKTNVRDTQPKINWYADSFHFVLVEGNVKEENKGLISLIRIDGTNKTEIYSNTLYSDIVSSAPGGDKFIVLTSFKSSDQTDLYTISIR